MIKMTKEGFTLISRACKFSTLKSEAFKGFTLMSKAREGFTLIELLIVISIIGLLSTLLLANMFNVREKGRDTQRKSDTSQIQKALEIYKDTQTPLAYVSGSSFSTLVSTLEDTAGGGVRATIKTVPHDPRCPDTNADGTGECTGGWVDYRYARLADVLTYTLTLCLENKSDPVGVVCPVNDPCLAAGGLCYTRTEP